MSEAHAEDGPRLRDLSEEDLLDRIFPYFVQSEDVLVPPGDDAAVLRAPTGSSPTKPMRFNSSPNRLPSASSRP